MEPLYKAPFTLGEEKFTFKAMEANTGDPLPQGWPQSTTCIYKVRDEVFMRRKLTGWRRLWAKLRNRPLVVVEKYECVAAGTSKG